VKKTGDKGLGTTGLRDYGIGIGGKMNLKNTLLALSSTALVAMAVPLRAQTGCVDSPEDPTIVLALVSGAGVLAASLWKLRRKHN
jgi:XrtJ-associated TM-motif-TM protein